MSICLLVKFRPIRDAPHKAPDVNEVEVVGLEGPFFLYVVDSKVAVWWDPGGLDRREVDTSDLSRRMGICEV
jgi:hypothetical protein